MRSPSYCWVQAPQTLSDLVWHITARYGAVGNGTTCRVGGNLGRLGKDEGEVGGSRLNWHQLFNEFDGEWRESVWMMDGWMDEWIDGWMLRDIHSHRRRFA